MRIAVLMLFASVVSFAQKPTVPHKMSFAGMTLVIRDDARKEIQKDVDLFTQSPKYFNIKVDRAKMYFPIIEEIFENERVPDDFKFLVIQESALISDAVSSSNAVGFWQFKDFTAIEMGLRVDREIDERKNIVSATRAAARYIKKNNFYFNNWLYALQAYQMGAGGVMQHVHDYESGAKHMEITSKTYWYVKKFLAHKIAYESAVRGQGPTKAVIFETKGKSKLSDIARDFAIDEEELKSYNKWVLRNSIPDDKTYAILIPTGPGNRSLENAVARAGEKQKESVEDQASLPTIIPAKRRTSSRRTISKSEYVFINGIPALKAKSGETVTSLADRVGVDISYFLKFNDISITDRIIPGAYYFVKKKNVRASTQQHVTSQGESLWSVSQQYGVQLRKLKKYNENIPAGPLREGMTVMLTNNHKVNHPIDESQPTLEVSTQETFTWSVKPDAEEPGANLQASLNEVIPVAPAQEGGSAEPGTEKQADVAEPKAVQPREEEPVVAKKVEETRAVKKEEFPAEDLVTSGTSGSHAVTLGETLYSIARKYEVSVTELLQWNDLRLEDGIKPGQVLQVTKNAEIRKSASGQASPAITQAERTEILHEVKSSDTLYSVARKYGVTIKDLMDWNKKTDFNISPGEKLRILQ